MKILICGFMGAGKSTLLKKCEHNQLGFECIDLDSALARDLKISEDSLGAWIEQFGFALFRQNETAKLKSLLAQKKSLVIALGGGSLNAEILDLIHKDSQSKLVFIDTPFDLCFERLKQDENRPLNKLNREELKKLYEQRLTDYRKADLILSESDIKEIEGLESLVHNLPGMDGADSRRNK